MNYIIIELIIYVTWVTVFLRLLNKKNKVATEELFVILFSMPITIIMELLNEFLYKGVYYPFSLFYFPDFKFPFAIVFSSSLFAWILYVVSRQITFWILNKNNGFVNVFQLGILLLLIPLNIIPEWLGPVLGYWKWHFTLPFTFRIQFAKYVFYFWFTFLPVLIAKFFSWQVMRDVPDISSSRN